MFVRAKETVFLAPEYGGLHNKGEEFEYDGPEHEFLEPAEKGAYYDYSLTELKNELTRRGMGVPPIADKKHLSELLVGDDNSAEQRDLEPKVVVPAEAQGSGSDKYGASAWTESGDGTDYPDDDFEESAADAVDKKYHQMTRDELKAELTSRKLDFPANAGDKKLRELLEADDAKKV